VKRIAQKIGEEGVETALALASGTDAEVAEESADLIFHLVVGLRARSLSLGDVVEVLRGREK